MTVAAIEREFPELSGYGPADFARIGTTRPVTMIAMTARTGSTHFCAALASVLGTAARPDEILNVRDRHRWTPLLREKATFGEVLAVHIRWNERVAFKTSWGDFAWFEERIAHLFPNLTLIYLDRTDIDAQAVSLLKAVVTGDWHHEPGTQRVPKPVSKVAATLDLDRFDETRAHLAHEKSEWERFFAKSGIAPLRIDYEAIRTDIAGAVAAAARHMGHPDADLSQLASSFLPLADGLNAAWLEQVRARRRA